MLLASALTDHEGTEPQREQWYALRVRPRHEKTVALSLCSIGYEGFLPLYKLRRHWATTSRDVQLPLFPQYVFCKFNHHHLGLPVLRVPSVRAILGFGNGPVPVEESEIQALQAVTGSGLPTEPHAFLRAGIAVRVTCGPLAGLEGILESVKGRDRLVISVSLLQRSVSVEIDRQWVLPLPKRVISTRPSQHATYSPVQL